MPGREEPKAAGGIMRLATVVGLRMTLLAGTLIGAAAQANDTSVESRLQELELKYEIDGDGDYKVVFSYSEESRTQLVFVSASTQAIEGITIREIFAPAAFVKDHNVDGTKALMLLRHSSDNKIGSWEIRGDVLYFVAKVAEPITGTNLGSVMEAVAATADDMEIELAGSDDL